MDAKELIGRTLAIWKLSSDSPGKQLPILSGTVQGRDDALVLNLSPKGPSVPIQSHWLEKIEPTPDYMRPVIADTDFYLTVGEAVGVPDEYNTLDYWAANQVKAKKRRAMWWIGGGAAIGAGWAIWQMLYDGAYITSVVVLALVGAWVGTTLVNKSKREILDSIVFVCGIVALHFFYSRSLQYLWPSSRDCCGTVQPGGYSYEMESFLLTMGTMMLYFHVKYRQLMGGK